MALLNVEKLTVRLKNAVPAKEIVSGVSFHMEEQKTFALVGGSGSGKTTTGLAVMGLLSSALTVSKGSIQFEGRDLTRSPEDALIQIRGGRIGMVFQDSLQALNPVFTIGQQIEEVLELHTDLTSAHRDNKILHLLEQVGISEPRRVSKSYAHQLSGGMRQRTMIAQAIAAGPKLIIADEPTSSLDVTLQARILELFRKLQDELKLSILLITHDLGVVQHLAHDLAVLSEGHVVESGPTEQILKHPKEEYTQRLLEAAHV